MGIAPHDHSTSHLTTSLHFDLYLTAQSCCLSATSLCCCDLYCQSEF